jgi:hypothetical protein
MSVIDGGRAPHVPEPPFSYQKLLRRLMIMCPTTARATDTGFELDAVPSIPGRRQLLVDCLECGQDHEWRLEDSFLG